MCCYGRWRTKTYGSVARGRAKKTGRTVKYEWCGFFALGIFSLMDGTRLRLRADFQDCSACNSPLMICICGQLNIEPF